MNVPSGRLLCLGCGAEIDASFLDCPSCHRLVYAAELKSLAAEARAADARGDPRAELATWRRALEKLPGGTTQRATIEERMRVLSATIDGRAPKGGDKQGSKGGKTAGALAGAGAVGATLLKSKALIVALAANGKLLLLGLMKLPTLLSMLAYAQMTGGRGLGLSLGIIGCIYIHEVGHVAALRRYGIDASAPMFIPGFGAVVRMKQYPTDPHEEARVGLAGPLWGLCATIGALALGAALGSPTTLSVASASATINIFNLVAVWQLDGSRGLTALSRTQRVVVGLVGLAVGFVSHQWTPGIVGVIALGRVPFEAGHPAGDRGMLALFASLLVLLPACAWVADTLRGTTAFW